MERRAINIGEEPQKKSKSKSIEFTHYLPITGEWITTFDRTPSDFKEILYFINYNGQTLFLCTDNEGFRHTYKGNLNDGTY